MTEPPTFEVYWEARREHAWLLRAEGLKYHEIALHLGVTKSAVAIMVAKFGRRVQAAINRQRAKRVVLANAQRWAIACEQSKLQAEADRWTEAWTTQ